jgi:aminoglycoside 6'-N-acetyltransferase
MKIEDNLYLKRLEDKDEIYLELEKWYKEKEVNKYFEQRELSLNEIKNKYKERTQKTTKVPVFIIEFNSKDIGIIQYTEKEDKVYEIDIFIGDVSLHSKGIGTKVVTYLSNYLLEKGKKVIMCPLKENKKAIRCYQKSGFKINKEFIDVDTLGNSQKYVEMSKE